MLAVKVLTDDLKAIRDEKPLAFGPKKGWFRDWVYHLSG
jgi:hypothetical protein